LKHVFSCIGISKGIKLPKKNRKTVLVLFFNSPRRFIKIVKTNLPEPQGVLHPFSSFFKKLLQSWAKPLQLFQKALHLLINARN